MDVELSIQIQFNQPKGNYKKAERKKKKNRNQYCQNSQFCSNEICNNSASLTKPRNTE